MNMNKYNRFLLKSKEKFGNTFSYPYIETEYITNKSKITVKCENCGATFLRRPNDLLNTKYPSKCPNCKNVENFYTYEDIIFATNNKNVVKFDGVKDIRCDKIFIKCEKHGENEVKLLNLINGIYKCGKCEKEKKILKRFDKIKEFWRRWI